MEKSSDKPAAKSTQEKLTYLDGYLKEKQKISLARAIGLSDAKIADILSGEDEPSARVCRRVAAYFFMSPKSLTDSSQELPSWDELRIDEDLVSIQRDDPENKLQFFKNKHYISRNYKALGFGSRMRLIISVLIVTIPLLAYTAFCTATIVAERVDTLQKYEQGSDTTYSYDYYDEVQREYHEKLQETSKESYVQSSEGSAPYYCTVKVGAELEKIKNISSSTSSYETRLQLFFRFDKDEFRAMFREYAGKVLWNNVIDDYYAQCESGELLSGRAQNFNDFMSTSGAYYTLHSAYFNEWLDANDERYYPGETPSNVLTDKETMFDIGNGEFVADSYGTLKELEEISYIDESGASRTLCYQKVKFNAAFEKAFDSARYPLDSVQFKMYILPIMDSQYLRYEPDTSLNVNGEPLSGFSPYFGITSGYRLVHESDTIKNFSLRVHYYRDINNDPAVDYAHTYRTELEIVVRANRAGISLFLQAFVNLFSVVIWIIIAFYNQSHNGEDSIGMLGTGLFGVISSMLVGLSMVSDAGIFSLITMINIFTLAVIMIMTYQSIAAKRAQVRKEKAQIAYNGVRLRIMFYVLSLCTVMMFVGLPMLSYMFGL